MGNKKNIISNKLQIKVKLKAILYHLILILKKWYTYIQYIYISNFYINFNIKGIQ